MSNRVVKPQFSSELSDKELRAYVAGLFDGEGCVSIYERSDGGGIRLQVGISMCNPTGLAIISEYWGGKVQLHRRAKENLKPLYQWRVFGLASRRFVEDIIRYSFVKKEELKLAIRYLNGENREEILHESRAIKSAHWSVEYDTEQFSDNTSSAKERV